MVMLNLQRIRGLKSLGGDYLGICSGFLVEVRDNDPGVKKLLPESINLKLSSSPAYRGRRRLTLLNYSGTCLLRITTSHTRGGVPHAKLNVYINEGTENDREVLAITRILASFRWPSGMLLITKPSLKMMSKGLPENLLAMGWTDLRAESGQVAFCIQLPKPRCI